MLRRTSRALASPLRASSSSPYTPSRALSSSVILGEDKNLIPIRTNLQGSALLNTPSLNKGAGFSREERAIFGLEGYLPWDVHSLEKQARRAYAQLQKQPSVILKHAFLA
jgi:malate dehydrogenase (oxaloacetate-decarboxylating)